MTSFVTHFDVRKPPIGWLLTTFSKTASKKRQDPTLSFATCFLEDVLVSRIVCTSRDSPCKKVVEITLGGKGLINAVEERKNVWVVDVCVDGMFKARNSA